MKCPACQHEFPNPVSAAGGSAKGRPKGFAVNSKAQKKAQKTLRMKRRKEKTCI